MKIIRTAGYIEAKKNKKNWNPNPWAVCTKSTGREDKKKYERCIQDVKKKQKKSDNGAGIKEAVGPATEQEDEAEAERQGRAIREHMQFRPKLPNTRPTHTKKDLVQYHRLYEPRALEPDKIKEHDVNKDEDLDKRWQRAFITKKV
jgi:hypothetical protein